MISQHKPLYPNAKTLLSTLSQQGFRVQVPIDIDEIAQRLDVQVTYDPQLQARGIAGEIRFTNSRPIITLEPEQNSYEPRRRFTLAHELGHYCLHSSQCRTGFADSQKSMSRTDAYWDPYEFEANTFAAQLLMPQDLVVEHTQQIIADYQAQTQQEQIPKTVYIDTMARRFNVSYRSMAYRLSTIGLVPEKP